MADLNASSWSELDASNDVTPPAGWPAGMQPNQVEPTARAEMGGMKRAWNRMNPIYSTTGSAGAYVLTPSNTSFPTLYAQGERYCVKANFTSVGGDTLNVNSLGALPIYKFGNAGAVAVGAGDIQSGAMIDLAYDAALNGGGGGFQLTTTPVTGGIIPAGTIVAFAATTAPAGWANCDGAAISRTGNAALFAAIGTTYGSGDGSTTFNKPDCRGRFLGGYDASNATSRLTANVSGGLTAAALANVGGEQSHTLSTAELAAHNHGINDPTHGHGITDPSHAHPDPSHAHSVADPTHAHGYSDPGHAHQLDNNVWANYFDSGPDKFAEDPGGQVIGTTNKGGQAVDTFGAGIGIAIAGAGTGIGIFGAFTGIGAAFTSVSVQGAGTGISTQNNGSGTTHNNVPPGIIVNYIIKL